MTSTIWFTVLLTELMCYNRTLPLHSDLLLLFCYWTSLKFTEKSQRSKQSLCSWLPSSSPEACNLLWGWTEEAKDQTGTGAALWGYYMWAYVCVNVSEVVQPWPQKETTVFTPTKLNSVFSGAEYLRLYCSSFITDQWTAAGKPWDSHTLYTWGWHGLLGF